jgi:branched-chain amino acid transport system ATP-binding protein
MLKVEELGAAYGRIKALDGISLSVASGQLVAIVGPNGAGKSTFFKTLSGVIPASSGSITYEGIDLLAVKPHERAHLGIAHVPEGRQLFRNMSVIENLEMGANTLAGRRNWRRNIDWIFSLFPILKQRTGQMAGTLSGGEQQMVAIGRGLASSPKLLLLDEPSMGLAPVVADAIFQCVELINKQDKITIILVEQRVAEALQSADQAYVLEVGRIVAQGVPAILMRDPRMSKAYLGL